MPTYDGTYKLAVEDGRTLIRDVEGGSLSTHVPLEIYSNYAAQGTLTDSRQLRLRTQPYLESNPANAYVTDMGIQNTTDNYFFITAPQNTSTVGDQNTFVISSTSNVGIGTTDPQQPLHVVGDSWITGTLSTSNVETSNLTVSNRLSGGTISVSNIEATSNLVVSGPVDVTGTLSSAGITSSAAVNVTGTISSSSTVTGTDLVVSGTAQGLHLTSTGTLSAAGITSSENIEIVGANKTLTSSNINTSNLVVGGPVDVTGTLSTAGLTSSENIEIIGANKTLTSSNVNTSNLVVSGPVDITGTLSTAGLTSSENIEIIGANKTLTSSNINTSNLVVSGPVDITGTLSTAGLTSSAAVNVTGTISSSSTVTGTDLVVSGTAQGLHLTSTGTLSAAGITSSAAVNVTGTISATGDIKVDAGNGLRARTGTFGSVETFGDQGSGYNGYSINGDAVFMSNGILYGLFDGAYNDWGVQCTQLGPTTIYYSGIPKLTTALNGVNVTGTISASSTISSAGLNVTGTISATGDITAFSDKRYKDDLVVIESALDKVKRLTGYTYTLHGNRSAGLLAQDVLEVLPEVVKGSEETNYSLAYGNLMGLIVEAIKDLDKKVDRILEKQ